MNYCLFVCLFVLVFPTQQQQCNTSQTVYYTATIEWEMYYIQLMDVDYTAATIELEMYYIQPLDLEIVYLDYIRPKLAVKSYLLHIYCIFIAYLFRI